MQPLWKTVWSFLKKLKIELHYYSAIALLSIYPEDTNVKKGVGGAWVAQWLKPLPLAQIMISGSWVPVPRRALCSAGSLLPPLSLPASLPAYDLRLSNK